MCKERADDVPDGDGAAFDRGKWLECANKRTIKKAPDRSGAFSLDDIHAGRPRHVTFEPVLQPFLQDRVIFYFVLITALAASSMIVFGSP